MSDRLALLAAWMAEPEGEHLEFKEAKTSFEFEELVKYCVALANEGGGRFVLGVTDKRPRLVVGSRAFQSLDRTKGGLSQRLPLRVDAHEITHPDGRVVVFEIPARPLGMPLQYKGAYWMRSGEGLVPMTPDRLKRIFEETGPDFSSEICGAATLADLDEQAIATFAQLWARKSGNASLTTLSPGRILADAELTVDGGVTYAALVLLGTRRGLGKHLAQSELIFEYRSADTSIPSQDRDEHRLGFFLFFDSLWAKINLRNEVQQFQDGLFRWDIRTFNEMVVREAILNAVSHRDYRLGGSIFVRQYPRRLEVVSPGGFPSGISPDNIIWKQAPRNRRVAEALARCGLVERAGQGMDRIFGECIRESKPRPDFSRSDAYEVSLVLHGNVQDERFLRFLEKVGRERLAAFGLPDLLVMERLVREEEIPDDLRPRLVALEEQGIIERIGRGRGVRHVLARQFYSFLGRKGAYTRRRGLDRETNKALLLKHIEDNRDEGSRMQDLTQVLPALSRPQIQVLLRELKAEARAHPVGRTRAGRWYPGAPSGLKPDPSGSQ